MITNSPEPQLTTIQGIPVIRIKTALHRWEMILSVVVACIAVSASLALLGKWIHDKSARAAEARAAETKRHQEQFKIVLSSIISHKGTNFTDQEKQWYSDMLQDITYDDVKSMLPKGNEDRQDLALLIHNNQVQEGPKLTGLKWNNGGSAQIRIIKRKNPSLDFQKIDVYSAPPDACSSKVIALDDSSNGTAEVCESHLDQRLEIVVIQSSE